MHEYAQIVDNKVHWRFQDELPLEELGRDKYSIGTGQYQIDVVEVTGLDPLPEEGWAYADGIFSPPDN